MRDNAALKMISEDQKQIALAATRDSAAMSVISVITIVFLPATFTAVSYTHLNMHILADFVYYSRSRETSYILTHTAETFH
jgi:hypothetical protein